MVKVKDVMTKAVTVGPDASRKEILAVAKKHPNSDIILVVDDSGSFLGDIHEDDLFYMMLPDDIYEDVGIELAFDVEKKFFAKTAKEIMRKHDTRCKPEDDIMEVAMTMMREQTPQIPVVNHWGIVQGVITQGQILRHLEIKD